MPKPIIGVMGGAKATRKVAEMAEELDGEDMPDELRRKMRHSHHRLKQRLLHEAIRETKALQSGESAESAEPGGESTEIDA